MKKLYWRPQSVSRKALILVALLSIAGAVLVEKLPSTKRQQWYDEKIEAAQLAQKSMELIKEKRFELGYAINPDVDPAESGLIGLPMSEVTSISGVLDAKQTSVNANWAAVIVEMLKRADINQGDVVAVGCSGSFPALNVATYAALQTLKVKPLVVSSAAASQWGANLPDFLWIDMERLLHQAGAISFRSLAASIGGYEDGGLGLSSEGRERILQSIEQNELKLLDPDESFEEKINSRMALYKRAAAGAQIKCYINVGGGTVSVGRSLGKKLFHPGLNRNPPARYRKVDGLMSRFAGENVPVIHLVQVTELAQRYGLTVSPDVAPSVGEASVFKAVGYNNWLAVAVLGVTLLALFGFIRSDAGHRLFQSGGGKKVEGAPEPMV